MQHCCLIFGEMGDEYIYLRMHDISCWLGEKIKNRKENLSRRQKKLVMGMRIVDRCFSSLSSFWRGSEQIMRNVKMQRGAYEQVTGLTWPDCRRS